MIDFLALKSISELTKNEFAEFVNIFFNPPFKTDRESSIWTTKFNELVPHPSGSDLMYYPEEGKESPEQIVEEVERYMRENNLPGFKK